MTSIADIVEHITRAVAQEDWATLCVVALMICVWVVLPIYFLLKALKMARMVMLMRCLPTSKARGVFIGLTEMKGTAEREPAVYSRLAERECVWYSYTVEEHWRRVEQQTYRDSKGNFRTRTVVHSGWTTVEQDTSPYDFYIRDNTGAIRVWPQHAMVEPEDFLHHTCDTCDPMYYGKGPWEAIPNSTYRRRFVERGIPIGAQLYIIGTTREQEDSIQPEFADADNEDPYIISTKDEKSLALRKGICAKLLPPAGIAVLLAPSFLEETAFPHNIYNPALSFSEQSLFLHASLIYVVLWLGWTFWQWYKEMVAARNRVAQSVAQVEVQLQRRYDLIRQLTDVVDAYSRHEQGMQERAAELRSLAAGGEVNMLAETCPELKAQTLFGKLHREWEDTEERLALAREYRNTIGNFFNSCLQTFPGGIILRILGFSPFRPS